MDECGSPNCDGLRLDERSGDRAEKRRRLSRQPTIQPEIAKETIERQEKLTLSAEALQNRARTVTC